MATKKPNPKTVRANAQSRKVPQRPSVLSQIPFPVFIALAIVVWIATRYWAAGAGLQWIGYPRGDQLYGDVATYDFWGNNMLNGTFPFSSTVPSDSAWTNDAWQYPPLAALIFMAGAKLHLGKIGFIQLALIADFAILAMLVWAGRERRDGFDKILAPANYVPTLIWLSTPILVGPLLLGRFDVFPTAAIIAALLATHSARRFGLWTAVGVMLKAWPVLGLFSVSRKAFKETFVWFAGSTLAIAAVLYVWWPNGLSIFFKGQGNRGLQIEAVGALPYMMFGQADNPKAIVFEYGAWQVVGPATRTVGLVMTVIFLALLAIIAWWRWQGRLEAISRFDIALLVVLISMVTSRVLSPQYSVWVMGLLAVAAFTPQKRFWLIATLLCTSTLFGHILFPWKYSDFQLLHVNGILIQTIRVVCLILATVLCWKNVMDRLLPPMSSAQSHDDPATADDNDAVQARAIKNVSFKAKGAKS